MLRAEDMATIKELKDALKSEKSTRNHMIKRGVELERKIQDALKRMEQVTSHDLKIAFRKGGAICGLECDAIEAVRVRLIQAAKGES